MLKNPFALLWPYGSSVRVLYMDKSSPRYSDEEIAMHVHAESPAALTQVHGSRVIRVRSRLDRTEEADGLATDVAGLALEIRIADCQAFLVMDPRHHVISLIHVGWRGLTGGIIQHLVTMLHREWDASPENLLVCGVPSLCRACATFTDPLQELKGISETFIHGRCVDLQAVADDQFQSLGVRPRNMERMPGCTRCSPEKYWTYRGGDREKVQSGRTNVLASVLL